MEDDSDKTTTNPLKSSSPPLSEDVRKEEDDRALTMFFDEIRVQGDESENTDHLRPGTVLNERYVIGNVLGRGGFGVTYVGFDKMLATKIAVKEYFPSTLASRNAENATLCSISLDRHKSFQKGLRLFLQEAEKIAGFAANPSVVSVRDFFEDNGTGYVVMDFVEGTLLSDVILNWCRLPAQDALNVIFPILDALSELHSVGLFHLDISPQNIIVTGNQTPVLIDFGGVRQITGEESRPPDIVLRPGYAALEQYSADIMEIGAWTDVYACGATLFEMITGNAPPPAPQRADNIRKHDKDPLVSPNDMAGILIHGVLNDAILKSLAVERADRFQTANELKAALVGRPLKLDKKTGGKKGRLWISLVIAISLAILGVIVQQIFAPS